jgi:hypothetical protein
MISTDKSSIEPFLYGLLQSKVILWDKIFTGSSGYEFEKRFKGLTALRMLWKAGPLMLTEAYR